MACILTDAGSGALGGAGFNSGSLMLALASAAQVAADYSEDDERRWADEDKAAKSDEPPPNPQLTPEGRLASVLEVNRILHAALAEKKGLLDTNEEEIKRLNKLMDRRTVEEPARKHHIEGLQSRMHAMAEPNGHVTREIKQMQKDIAKMEAKIGKANEDNLTLSDQHRQDRARMVEQQARLRTLGKRERELAKHLDHLARKLNEAVQALEEEKQTVSEASSQLEMDKLPKDFRDLPGIRLNKLVGKSLDQPPSVPGAVAAMAAASDAAADSAPADSVKEVAADGAASTVKEEEDEAALDEATLHSP